jgi:hypothetical protein
LRGNYAYAARLYKLALLVLDGVLPPGVDDSAEAFGLTRHQLDSGREHGPLRSRTADRHTRALVGRGALSRVIH